MEMDNILRVTVPKGLEHPTPTGSFLSPHLSFLLLSTVLSLLRTDPVHKLHGLTCWLQSGPKIKVSTFQLLIENSQDP
jgi:hypothetical protein